MATSDYIDPGNTTDPDQLRNLAVAGLEEGVPGLQLPPSNVVYLTFDQVAEMVAEAAQVFVNAEAYRFRTEGREIHGVAPIETTNAVASTTWTLTDPDPDGETSRTIPAGSQFSISGRVFTTDTAATGAPGDDLAIQGTAVVGGSDGSGLSATPQLLEAFAFVDSIALTGVTTGGVDGETDTEYDERLSRYLRHVGRPILPGDFSEKAREVVGVARALAIDGYNADAATEGQEKTVTIVPVDDAGAAVSTGVKNAVKALIESEREVNWDVFVIDPTYTTVTITATVTMWPGYSAGDVQARCVAAIYTFLDPASWGDPPVGERPDWNDEPIVMRSEAFAALDRVDGVRHVTALTINGSSTANLTLTGHGALPAAAAPTITVA